MVRSISSKMTLKRVVLAIVVVGIVLLLASRVGRFLVVDDPQPSDAIVVLAGETDLRPSHAIELLRQHAAPHVFLDVQVRDVLFDQHLTEIAQRYIDGLPEAANISICPVVGFSTFAEAGDAARCLRSINAHRALIVTSDFHTRRALIIFRHRLPQYQFSVAAARGAGSYGNDWWRNREWAKATFDEYLKLTWFELVDRWR
jgi:hypothetical protein